MRTSREHVPVKTACESEQTLSVQRYMRLKNCETRSISKGGRWPCWIRFRLLPRPTALGERCSVLDTVSKRARTPPRSPIRARAGKCVLSVDAREKSASDTCEPPVTSKSHGHADRLIDLVLSSSTDDTVNVFTESFVLRSSFFPPEPLLLCIDTEETFEGPEELFMIAWCEQTLGTRSTATLTGRKVCSVEESLQYRRLKLSIPMPSIGVN